MESVMINDCLYDKVPVEFHVLNNISVKTSLKLMCVLFVACACSPSDEYDEASLHLIESADTWLSGQISDSITGEPLPNVLVRTEPPTQQTASNINGQYRIKIHSVESKNYTIITDREGYHEHKTYAVILEGRTNIINMLLDQMDPSFFNESSSINYIESTATRGQSSVAESANSFNDESNEYCQSIH